MPICSWLCLVWLLFNQYDLAHNYCNVYLVYAAGHRERLLPTFHVLLHVLLFGADQVHPCLRAEQHPADIRAARAAAVAAVLLEQVCALQGGVHVVPAADLVPVAPSVEAVVLSARDHVEAAAPPGSAADLRSGVSSSGAGYLGHGVCHYFVLGAGGGQVRPPKARGGRQEERR